LWHVRRGIQSAIRILGASFILCISALSRLGNIKIACFTIEKLSLCSFFQDATAGQEENSAISFFTCRKGPYRKHVYLRLKNAVNLQSPDDFPSIEHLLFSFTFAQYDIKGRIGRVIDPATSSSYETARISNDLGRHA
jgi:hypothetical protein